MDEKFKTKELPASLLRELEQVSTKPSWQSSNEGVHERVNFDDTIWGFELAGGAYYSTPLRVTKVKPNSRAERAGIKVGDVLQTINGVGTYTLTIQEAHDMILESGIEIKLELYAPDVEKTMHTVYQDEIKEDANELRRLRELEEALQNLQYKGAKTNKLWSEIWPCNKKRDILYKESNCFLVPSAFTMKHKERLLKKSDSEEK